MKHVIVVGGGAAGMFAALAAAENGHSVSLFEKNEKLGKKLYITGKGRCNLTNASDMDTLFSNIITNPKFLYSALYAFDNFRVIDFFEAHGVKTKTYSRRSCGKRRFIGRWVKYLWRCRYRLYRRHILSWHRLYWRRIYVCKNMWA